MGGPLPLYFKVLKLFKNAAHSKSMVLVFEKSIQKNQDKKSKFLECYKGLVDEPIRKRMG